MTCWDTGGFEFSVFVVVVAATFLFYSAFYRKRDHRLNTEWIQNIKWKKRLGSGEVASVWIASLLSDKHSKMAVKKQSPSAKIMRAHPDITVRLYGKMFLTEIQCMQKLNGQSNICNLFNFGFENLTCYMAIELADTDLETVIIDKRMFDKHEVGWQVSNALEHCHKHGIVHRDIKTQNILCFHHNQDWTYKLADFGIAGLIDGDGKVMRLHSAEAGPTGYKAPEMFEPVYGPEVDVFSLGAILQRLFGGPLPVYLKASAGNLLLLYVEAKEINDFLATLTESDSYKITEVKTVSIDDFYGHLNADLVEVFKKLMEPIPQKRMTIKEFRDGTFFRKFKNKHADSNFEACKKAFQCDMPKLDENLTRKIQKYFD